ncbi:copper chaperone PCu(A)C [Alcanivorax jadensis]|uniref:copper chaperone PCu(A)C n=1 Tax=Alcanivorax jadensis TaxID=64988 RepID=UPI0026ECD34B|nr:copper chaperone PCu(A)C [Alcanivorax jadensis]
MPKRSFKSLLVVAVLAFAMPAHAELTFADPWLRAVPPVSPTMAGYVTLNNSGDEAVTITGVSTPAAGHTMLHDVESAADGSRRMVHLHHLEIPARGSVPLAPGGRHLMLMKLAEVPAPGETVEICFHLKGGEDACTGFPVKRASQTDG